jgi:hypothetical protein
VSGLSLSTGPPLEGYPRRLSISTSMDGTDWDVAWSGAMAGPTLTGVLRDARTAESRIDFPPRRARLIRLEQLGMHPDFGWFIAELKAYGSAGS